MPLALYGIVFFGLLMAAVSLAMIVSPTWWSGAIVRFAGLPYMHPFEILTRIGFGALFLVGANQTAFPLTIRIVGYLLLAVGVGLLLTPPSRHKRFALWSAERFKGTFRPAGMGSMAFGLFLVYAAVKGPVDG